MIKNKEGETFEYEGKTFAIGDIVYANDRSAYEGLCGRIKEIRTDADKDTDNDTPDIYCAFFTPLIPFYAEKIEERFSKLYGEPKKLEDLALDEVIMAPDMLWTEQEIMASATAPCSGTVYYVYIDWTYHGESALDFVHFRTLESAKIYMLYSLAKDMEDNYPPFNYRDDEDFCEDVSETSYEIYINGFYCECHYSIYIEEDKIRDTVGT